MSSDERIRLWNQHHAYKDKSMFSDKLRRSGLSTKQVLAVLMAIDSTCNECWDAPTECQCWNDE